MSTEERVPSPAVEAMEPDNDVVVKVEAGDEGLAMDDKDGQEDGEAEMAGQVKEGKVEKDKTVKASARKSVAPDDVLAAEKEVALECYNTHAWSVLLASVQKAPIEVARPVFERFLAVFPTSARHWKFYLDAELSSGNLERVESLFKRCLVQLPNIHIWATYLRYIKLVKAGAEDELQATETAFEFAIKNIGIDLEATQLWSAYIKFLKEVPVANKYEEGQRTTKIRKVYQRAIILPIDSVETLWREYDLFENKLNKDLAKGLLSELQPRYMLAKMASREKKRITKNLTHHLLARPPLPRLPEQTLSVVSSSTSSSTTTSSLQSSSASPALSSTLEKKYQEGNLRAVNQLAIWRAATEYEKSNPQRLDAAVLKMRVVFVYRQALLSLRHFPEVWLDTAMWYVQCGCPAEAAAIFVEARAALAESCPLVMDFLHAEYEERRKDFKAATAIYEALMTPSPAPAPAVAAPAPTTPALTAGAPVVAAAAADCGASVDPLVYIQYMRFARRSLGLTEARRVFLMAKKQGCKSYHVFVAAALMEDQRNNDPVVAGKIFAMGFKDFAAEANFVLQYLTFLSNRNDHTNMRMVFERCLPLLDAKALLPVVSRLVEFERMCGDLESIEKAEARRRQAIEAAQVALESEGLTGAALEEEKERLLRIKEEEEEGRKKEREEWEFPEGNASGRVLSLLDRYRFFDKWPCTQAYRQSLDLVVASAGSQETGETQEGHGGRGRRGRGGARGGRGGRGGRGSSGVMSSASSPTGADDESNKWRPNVEGMIPYTSGLGCNSHLPLHVLGGSLSPHILGLSMVLPTAQHYAGPQVNLDVLVRLLANCIVPDAMALKRDRAQKKRKLQAMQEEASEVFDQVANDSFSSVATAAPLCLVPDGAGPVVALGAAAIAVGANDLYRQRQMAAQASASSSS